MADSTGRAQRNFLGFIYMRLLHAPDFERFTLEFDRRFTYDLDDRTFIKTDTNTTPVFSFDINRTFDRAQSRINKLESGNRSIFKPFADQKSNLTQLRQLWNSSESNVDRLSAGILATVYQMEKIRRGGGQ